MYIQVFIFSDKFDLITYLTPKNNNKSKLNCDDWQLTAVWRNIVALFLTVEASQDVSSNLITFSLNVERCDSSVYFLP